MSKIRTHWPLWAGLAVLWGVVTVLAVISVSWNKGYFVYALDDAYIHMAIAKNIVEYGVWGITRYEFASASSSILWTGLLSLVYNIFGSSELTPFILNVFFASLLLVFFYHILKETAIHKMAVFGVMLALIFFAPLPALIFGGMEHALHTLLTVSFAYHSALFLTDSGKKNAAWLLGLAPLLAAARYESIVLLFIFCIFLLFRKEAKLSIVLFVLGLLPILIFGSFTRMYGAFFLPNSVLLKMNGVHEVSLPYFVDFFVISPLKMLFNESAVLFVFILLSLVLVMTTEALSHYGKTRVVAILFIFTTFIHLQFGATGWFFRYEAYLVALGILVAAMGITEYAGVFNSFPVHAKKSFTFIVATVSLVLLLISPLLSRGLMGVGLVPYATNNIFSQQYQMGLFLRQYYQGESVAANDVGAINYLANIRNLDLWGLGSQEVTQAKLAGLYTSGKIYKTAVKKQVKIAIIYDEWFHGGAGIPSAWKKAGEWTIQRNVICGGDTVSFYAVQAEEFENLIANLEEYSVQLPEDVVVRLYHLR